MDLKKFSGKRICVAVSGGADSVALLHYLKTCANDCGYSLSTVHCEHGIRGEASVTDMRFVEKICRDLEIPLTVFREDCVAKAKAEKTSLETAARNFRYACFERLVLEGKTDYIATAHHLGDEAETVLFRISRGASLTGASGMAAERGYLLRPFLDKDKAFILDWVQKSGLSYREDETNASVEFTRNKIRLEVLPRLEEAVPGATENIARFALFAARDDEVLYELARELLLKEESGYLVRFEKRAALFERAALLALKSLGVEKDYTATHLSDAYALQEKERGAKIDLPENTEAVKTEKGIVFRRKTPAMRYEKSSPKPFNENGFDGGRYEVIIQNTLFEDGSNGWKILRADGDKIPKTAWFRFRKEGDKLQRFGGGSKSLKKFFNEEKIPVDVREYLPLIAEENGEVYAVCGVEISEKIKVTADTENVLYIGIKEL